LRGTAVVAQVRYTRNCIILSERKLLGQSPFENQETYGSMALRKMFGDGSHRSENGKWTGVTNYPV
jgi:hypothetical protein